jgi:hypothetical protein
VPLFSCNICVCFVSARTNKRHHHHHTRVRTRVHAGPEHGIALCSRAHDFCVRSLLHLYNSALNDYFENFRIRKIRKIRKKICSAIFDFEILGILAPGSPINLFKLKYYVHRAEIPIFVGGKTCLYKFGALGILSLFSSFFPSHVTVLIAHAHAHVLRYCSNKQQHREQLCTRYIALLWDRRFCKPRAQLCIRYCSNKQQRRVWDRRVCKTG